MTDNELLLAIFDIMDKQLDARLVPIYFTFSNQFIIMFKQ